MMNLVVTERALSGLQPHSPLLWIVVNRVCIYVRRRHLLTLSKRIDKDAIEKELAAEAAVASGGPQASSNEARESPLK